MASVRIEAKCVEEVGQRLTVKTLRPVSQAYVSHSPHIVRPQIKRLIVDLESSGDILAIRHGRSVLVPERVISRVLSDAIFKVPCGVSKAAPDKGQHAKSQGYISILWLESMRLNEGLIDCRKVWVLRQRASEVAEIRVILEPVLKMSQGIVLLKFVRA